MAVAGMFSLLYGCARFFTEYFRVPDYEVHFGGITISAGQMLSVPMIVLGIILLVLAYRLKQQAQAPSEAALVGKSNLLLTKKGGTDSTSVPPFVLLACGKLRPSSTHWPPWRSR
jgi:hypothetical protein